MSSRSGSLLRRHYLISIFFGVIIASAASADDETDEIESLENPPYHPKVETSTLRLIRDAGYPAEDHIVTTEDGYLLTMHRIPNESGSPIVIQHGILCSSADWLTLGKGKAIPYLLADLGYDVWLGNYRGNIFSRGHVNLTTKSEKYWDFSWHEMGIYDLPAMINYVTSHKDEKVIYIGHSMGTTGSFVMAAERPEMHDKVKLIICLAPVAYMTHMKSPLRILTPFTDGVELLVKISGYHELLPHDHWFNILTRHACSFTTLDAVVCTNILFAVCGYDPFQIDYAQLKTITSRSVAGTSTKCLFHYAQEVNSHKFRQYDYGVLANFEKYGALTPPEYEPSKMLIPTAFFYGDNDWLTAVSDLTEFYQKLPNGIALERVNFTSFNHLDFLWGRDARELLYEPMIKLIQSYH